MRTLVCLLACVTLCLASFGCRRDATAKLPGGKIIDLSHPFDAQTIYWPTEEGFKLEKEHDGITPQGYYYASNKFSAPEHGGTHIDAPAHFAKGGETVDQIALNRLVAPGVLIDVRQSRVAATRGSGNGRRECSGRSPVH